MEGGLKYQAKEWKEREEKTGKITEKNRKRHFVQNEKFVLVNSKENKSAALVI